MADENKKEENIESNVNEKPEKTEIADSGESGKNPILSFFMKKSVIFLVIVIIVTITIFLLANKKVPFFGSSSSPSFSEANQNVFEKQPQTPDHPPVNIAQLSQPKEAGTYWSQSGNMVFSDKGLIVNIGKTMNSKKFEISFDNNDNYEINFYLNDEKIDVMVVAKRTEPDLQGLFVSLNKVPAKAIEKGYDKVNIIPYEGDGMYSIGHIRFID